MRRIKRQRSRFKEETKRQRWIKGQVLNHCTKEQTATHHNQTRILEKSIGNWFLFTRCTVYFWNTGTDTPVCQGTRDNGKKDGGKDFTLPLCIQVFLHAKWSCHTMTMGGSGWAERRWVDLSRSFCVCRCQSSLGIPMKTAARRNYCCGNLLWFPIKTQNYSQKNGN